LQGKTAARRQGRAGHDRAGHGRRGRGRAWQGIAGHGRAGHGRAWQGMTGQGRYTQPNITEHDRNRLNACTQQATCIDMGPGPNMQAWLHCAAKCNIKQALVPVGAWQKRQCYCNKSCFG